MELENQNLQIKFPKIIIKKLEESANQSNMDIYDTVKQIVAERLYAEGDLTKDEMKEIGFEVD